MTRVLGKDEIAAVQARADAATPGPWGYDSGDYTIERDGWSVVQLRRGDRFNHATGAFIAASREDVPNLLATLAARDAEIERLRAACIAKCGRDEEYDGDGRTIAVDWFWTCIICAHDSDDGPQHVEHADDCPARPGATAGGG